MATAGNITAVLTLNATSFQNGLNSSLGAVEKFKASFSKSITPLAGDLTKLESSLRLLSGTLDTASGLVNRFSVNAKNLSQFSTYANSVNRLANALKILSSDTINAEQGLNVINNMFKYFRDTLNGTEIKISGLIGEFTQLANSERSVASATRTSVEAQLQAVNSLNNNRNAVMSLITGENQLAVAEKQESVASEQSSVAHDKASASMEKQTASTNRLGKAMSSLRMMGTMVASMMVYNFAHNLITATRETVNAKSEMEGYFQMLGFTTSQIGDFNKALDETVAKFPRLNKYALGETISSIGVEFELTTEEMKKAMPVVSMITSEYLRAGRNVNEASLAVKDILQGEFQRLSRETGVKGEQLMATGLWSGDKSDVMGLLKALDKVGKDRNWDIFVTKANSLNDAVLIMQNRFGEWSADMVNRFQPALLSVTNSLITLSSLFASGLNGVLDWLSGDGIAQGIIKWGGLVTAIGGVVTALIHYRTGANLTQIAQMGLTRSIGASILGLEAETVAEYGLRNAIVTTVTGIEAETLANEKGIITRRARFNAIMSSIMGLEMETVAQYGLRTAILSNITGMEAEVVANKSLLSVLKANKMAVIGLGLELTALTTIIGTLLIAYGNIAMEIMQNTETMKNFHKLVNEGDDVLKDYNDKIEGLYQRTKDLKEIQSKYTQGSKEYINVGKAHKKVVDLINQSLEDRKDLEKAIDISKKAQERYTTDNEIARLKYEQQINQAIIDTGISTETARVLSSDYLREANDGAEQLSETTRRLYQDYRSSAGGIVEMASAMDQLGYSSDEVADKVHELQTAKDFIIKGELQMGEAENLTEYLSGWATKQYGEITITVTNIKFKLDQDDVIGAFESAWKGVVYGIAGTLGKTPDEVREIVENQGGWGWTFINAILPFDDLDYLFNVKLKEFLESLPDPLEEFATWLGSGEASTDLSGSVDDFFKPLQDTIMEYWNNFISFDWLFNGSSSSDTGGGSEESTGSSVSKSINIADILRNIVDFSTDGLSQLGWEVASNFGNAVVTGILGIPASLGISDLLNAILNIDVDALGQWVDENIITPLKDAVTLGILNTPVLSGVSDFLGLGEEPQAEAETEGMEIGTSFNTGIQTGLAPVDTIINSAFEGLNLDDITANFTANTQTMTTNASTTAQNVSGSYTTMKDNQRSALDSMVSHNTTQFEAMKVKSNASLSQMRDSTSNVTSQMTTAWSMMKDSIIASAEKIKTDSSNRFSTLSDRIGGFYRKIQNPSLWGSAGGTPSRRGVTNRRVGGSVARALKPNGYGGGLATRSTNATMTVSRLKNELCPDGNCGNIFDGYDSNDVVNVWEFLQSIGEGHGLGGWNFASNHNQYIKTKSDEWKTAPPIIQLLSGIATNTSFKVGEFNEATPKISFSTFQDIATAIFSQIPYRLYFDSSWKGSWLGALQAGACNCYDGALALMALAQTFGFSASMGHGTWTNPDGKQTAHVWAIINGIKMDTTGMQQRGTWNPSASAGGSPTSSGSDKTVNITIDMQGATIYGVEDLDNRIEQGVRRGLREEFNDSYSVII